MNRETDFVNPTRLALHGAKSFGLERRAGTRGVPAEIPECGQGLACGTTGQCELARCDVLQSNLQLAHSHGVRRTGGVEDRLGWNLGAETKTASGLGPVHFDGGTFGGRHRLRHCFW